MTGNRVRLRSAAVGLLAMLSLVPLLLGESNEILHKSRDLEKVKQELEEKRRERERLKKESEELSREVKEERSRIRNVEESLLHTRHRTHEVGQEVASVKNERDRVLTEMEESRRTLIASSRGFYMSYWTAGPNAPSAVVSRLAVRQKAGRYGQLKGLSKETQSSLSRLLETQAVLVDEVKKQQTALSSAQTVVHEKNRMLTRKLTQREAIENELKALEKTAVELASLIDVLRTRAKKEAAAERQARLEKEESGVSPIATRSLPWPVRGLVKTKFGRQRHPTLDTTFISNGVLIKASEPQAVAAVSDGKVLFAGQFMSYGPMVVLEHAGDWYTVYGQMSRWDVEKGQEIRRGESVGWTGFMEGGGAQAYFELRFYGKSVDPLPWLEAAAQ